MYVKIKKAGKSSHPIERLMPEKGTAYAVGFDLRAAIDEDITIEPMKWAAVPTGIAVDMAKNMEMQIRPRSGLAYHQGVTILNSPGTIDPDYFGEVCAIVVNLGQSNYVVRPLDRIAQAVFHKTTKVDLGTKTKNQIKLNLFGENGLKDKLNEAAFKIKNKISNLFIDFEGDVPPEELTEHVHNNKVREGGFGSTGIE